MKAVNTLLNPFSMIVGNRGEQLGLDALFNPNPGVMFQALKKPSVPDVVQRQSASTAPTKNTRAPLPAGRMTTILQDNQGNQVDGDYQSQQL